VIEIPEFIPEDDDETSKNNPKNDNQTHIYNNDSSQFYFKDKLIKDNKIIQARTEDVYINKIDEKVNKVVRKTINKK